MGYIKSGLRIANAVISLGGSEALRESHEKYQAVYNVYQDLYNTLRSIENQAEQTLNNIGQQVSSLIPYFQKVNNILNSSYHHTFNLNNHEINRASQMIDSFNTSYNDALNVGFGGIAGSATAIGAWTLVSTFGAASTGTAISSLYGVATYNATMAWFGGGALAAGGGGMAVGLTTLSVIAAAPAVIFATYTSYKKADKIDAARKDLKPEIQKVKNMIPMAEERLHALKILEPIIRKQINEYIQQVNDITNILFSSKWKNFKRSCKKIFTKNIFSKNELLLIKRLNQITIDFLTVFEKTYDIQ